MTEKQATIFGALEPVAPHRDDVVECSDGSDCSREEALADCRGEYHRTDEERHDADVTIVEEVLDEAVKWADDYCTGNSDYPDGYFGIVDELSHEWPDRVEEWVRNEWGDYYGRTELDDCIGEVVKMVCAELDADFHCEPEYNGSDYSGYSGDGCCLWGFKIEENEEQIGVLDSPELSVLHEQRRLDDVLDSVNCDAYVSRSQRREKNEETGYYENVGRQTYMPYPHNEEYPTFEIYHGVSGGWDFVVSAEDMNRLLSNAILEYHGYAEYAE
jgi:hypothetical protein